MIRKIFAGLLAAGTMLAAGAPFPIKILAVSVAEPSIEPTPVAADMAAKARA